MDVSGWNKELSAIETLLELSLRDTLEAEFAGAILIRLQGMLYIQCKALGLRYNTRHILPVHS